MAHQIDCLDITGMKQTDFMQLREIFEHVMEEDVRWDRVDYWDARNQRLLGWLEKINFALIDCKIKEK